MIQDAFWGILIPFLGTSLGAGCVFFLKNSLRDGIQRALTGFAAGVMVAASVWSLLIPAMEQAADLGRLAFFPAAVGFWLGILFLLLLDHLIPHQKTCLHRAGRTYPVRKSADLPSGHPVSLLRSFPQKRLLPRCAPLRLRCVSQSTLCLWQAQAPFLLLRPAESARRFHHTLSGLFA